MFSSLGRFRWRSRSSKGVYSTDTATAYQMRLEENVAWVAATLDALEQNLRGLGLRDPVPDWSTLVSAIWGSAATLLLSKPITEISSGTFRPRSAAMPSSSIGRQIAPAEDRRRAVRRIDVGGKSSPLRGGVNGYSQHARAVRQAPPPAWRADSRPPAA